MNVFQKQVGWGTWLRHLRHHHLPWAPCESSKLQFSTRLFNTIHKSFAQSMPFEKMIGSIGCKQSPYRWQKQPLPPDPNSNLWPSNKSSSLYLIKQLPLASRCWKFWIFLLNINILNKQVFWWINISGCFLFHACVIYKEGCSGITYHSYNYSNN